MGWILTKATDENNPNALVIFSVYMYISSSYGR
eukprot:SAG11_NODE_30080_length_303_cov_0.975610_1_plen_32_part_10